MTNEVENYGIRTAKVAVYQQYIHECDYKEEMNNLLKEYLETGDTEIEDTIEAQYPLFVIREANFKAGCFYQEMAMPIGKLRQFCVAHGIKWNIAKIGLIVALLIFVCIYQIHFRYEYKTYKGNYNQVQIIKIDKITGKSFLSLPIYKEQREK